MRQRREVLCWSFVGQEEGKTLRTALDVTTGQFELEIDFHLNGTREAVTLSRSRAERLCRALMRALGVVDGTRRDPELE